MVLIGFWMVHIAQFVGLLAPLFISNAPSLFLRRIHVWFFDILLKYRVLMYKVNY